MQTDVTGQPGCTLENCRFENNAQFGVRVTDLVPGAMDELAPLAVDGLIKLDEDGLKVEELGRWFLRNVAMVFDAYLESGDDKPRYSRTV